MNTKEKIREEIRQKLRNQDSARSKSESEIIRESLYKLKEFKNSNNVLVYISMPGEVDTFSVIRQCFLMKKRVIAPRMNYDTNELDLREITNLDSDLEKNKLGVLEPREACTNPVDLNEIDCAIVPGLAFDKNGNRLGRGKGCFDRLLAGLPKGAYRVGLAYSFQMMDSIPVNDFDKPVDVVLSS
jgi:5-formyltetrahydrofolate cyclo-ligase